MMRYPRGVNGLTGSSLTLEIIVYRYNEEKRMLTVKETNGGVFNG